MENENNKNEKEKGKYTGYFSKRLKAGKRRTYFFDVRSTNKGDFFLTITESKKKFDDSYESHKVFLYKEDFKKFLETLNETIQYVKTELMPDYDFESERPPVKASNNNHNNHADNDGIKPLKEKRDPITRTDNLPDTPETSSNTNPSISDDEEVDWGR